MPVYLPGPTTVHFNGNRMVANNITITAAATDPWITTPVSTTTTSTVHVWNNWITSSNSAMTAIYRIPAPLWQDEVWDAWGEDEGQLAEMQRQRDELQARREQQSRERLAADQQRAQNMLVAHDRALDLLDNLLTPEEQAFRAEHQKIKIEGSDGQLYWLEMLRRTVHGNIVRTDEHGCMLGRACVAPGMYGDTGVLPTADGWVGQYLGLKFDAERFLSHANWSGVRVCQAQQAAA